MATVPKCNTLVLGTPAPFRVFLVPSQMFVTRGHPLHLQCLSCLCYHGSWEELCRLSGDDERPVTLLRNPGYPRDRSTHSSIFRPVLMAWEAHFPFLLFQVQGPWEQKHGLLNFWFNEFCFLSKQFIYSTFFVQVQCGAYHSPASFILALSFQWNGE